MKQITNEQMNEIIKQKQNGTKKQIKQLHNIKNVYQTEKETSK